ncbi:7959_t:CDS:2 [Paraglomus brasilianum]|uniref:7959_t:CDS:1 n=1 Tax=Paraglomus brasilianum TaxID=144538 RepID=A0A9N8ZUS9_9GLOM|nr:7959_t:CDS:2 [Paraglomus brasilianum]
MPSEQELKEYKETFTLFDKKGAGTIPSETLGDVLRALGQNPTQTEVKELAESHGSEINFDEFVKVLQRPGGFAPAGTYEEFVDGFQVFDKKRTGYISVTELKYVLTNLGEKLSEAEVEDLLKDETIDDNGSINYHEFVKKILSS